MSAPAELHIRPNVEPGLMSHSGLLVPSNPASTIVPPLEDIGLSLSRICRFGGHTRRWWTVLDHSLFCAQIARKMAYQQELSSAQTRELMLAALLHDAAESLTSDVPTWFKTPDFKKAQVALEDRFAAAYLPSGAYSASFWKSEVKEIDWRALLAEAYIVGPPELKFRADVEKYFGEAPMYEDVSLLAQLLNKGMLGSDPTEIRRGADAPPVRAFLQLYRVLR